MQRFCRRRRRPVDPRPIAVTGCRTHERPRLSKPAVTPLGMDSGQVRCRSVGRVGRGVGAAPRAGGRRAAARHSGPDPRERSRRAAGRRPGLPVVWSGWMPAGTRKPPWPPRGLSRRGLRAVLSRPPAAVRLLRDAVAALAGFSRCSGLRDARRRTGVAAAFGRARAERGIVEPAGRTGARGQSRSRCRSDAGSCGHATRHDATGPRPSGTGDGAQAARGSRTQARGPP